MFLLFDEIGVEGVVFYEKLFEENGQTNAYDQLRTIRSHPIFFSGEKLYWIGIPVCEYEILEVIKRVPKINMLTKIRTKNKIKDKKLLYVFNNFCVKQSYL